MEMKYDVFISYSSKDQKVAEGICGYLERYGLRCFVAYRDIPKGKVWAEAIADGIDDSAMMVVVFSQNFNRSKQVDREIELAAEDNKPILTYRITDDPLQGAKKYYLKNLNWIDAFPNPQENFGKLYTNVCQLLGKTPSTTVVPQPQPKPQRNLTWLWVLLGVLVFGGVVFVVIRGIENKRERERIAYEQQMEQERIHRQQQAAADNAFFQNCNDVADYRSYLNKYPDGLNAELAKNKIGRHVADSIAKAQEAERQRQIAAENERKAQEAERQRQMAAEAERKAREAERQRQIAAENERKAQEAERQRQIAAENERKAREEAARFKDKTFTVNGVSFEMVAVNGGTFTMGATSEQGGDADDDERPTHSVTLDDYYIGKFEVTQELWEAVMGSNPSRFKGSNLPVERVRWNDCQEFITKLNSLTGANFRLPTEAEWEYAARGGNKSRGYKYSGGNSISEVAWYYGNSGSKTHAVGTKRPNELGIYDMSGNVYEWCQDWYGSYGSGSQTNPTGSSSGSYRVLRGGGWSGYARNCRVSSRYRSTPGDRYSSYGFRLVLVP